MPETEDRILKVKHLRFWIMKQKNEDKFVDKPKQLATIEKCRLVSENFSRLDSYED